MQRKSFISIRMSILLCGICIFVSNSYGFESGSTGADGEFAPTGNTQLQIPESGICNFTTVNIPSGVTVTFRKNSKNTPVTILATGDVTISGTISVNGGGGNNIMPGAGGPGGFDGGVGGWIKQIGKKGEGPGGGVGGSPRTCCAEGGGCGGGGGFSRGGGGGGTTANEAPGGAGGPTYGNERILPLIGGSGGGGGGGTNSWTGGAGGGGGGAIVIASSRTINVTGTITANGGTGSNGESVKSGCCWYTYYRGGGGGGGAGGSIRLIANIIAGNGTLSAAGGGGGTGWARNGGAGSAGRIRLEAVSTARTAGTNPPFSLGYPYAAVPTNVPTLTITSVGGVDVPAVTTGSYRNPDVTLPFNVSNPMTVVVSAVNIPIGNSVTVKASPQVGTVTSGSGTLSGTDTSSSADVQLNISTAYPSVLTASVTFQLASLGIGPVYAQGELVEKVRVEAAMGGGSTMTYITVSGKEIPASQLKS